MPTILRWVGSKRSQAKHLAAKIWPAWRSAGGRYFEPFLGSASVPLALLELGGLARSMVLSDALDTLIETYQALTLYTEKTIEAFAELARKAECARKRALFNELRAKTNTARRQGCFCATPRPEIAAAFLYLNLRGFNGLVRQNKKGDFNMTIGRSGYKKRDLRLPDRGELLTFANELRGATLLHADFEHVIELASAGDVIYCDPPYDGTFCSYDTKWGVRDQGRLARALQAAHYRGATIFASNADTPLIRGLYPWASIEETRVHWQVGGRKDRRIDAKEVLISAPSVCTISELIKEATQ